MIIGICSCHQVFKHPDWQLFERHITPDNEHVHQWVEVPDIKLVMEPRYAKTLPKKGKSRLQSAS
jgi:hypothetical protein